MFEILFKANDVLDDPIRIVLPTCGCQGEIIGGNYARAQASGAWE
jgi:hypothetical protein